MAENNENNLENNLVNLNLPIRNLCRHYYENMATKKEKSFVETNWEMYLTWLDQKRRAWLSTQHGITRFEFYDNMDDAARRNFLQDAGCPWYKISFQPLAIIWDDEADEDITRGNFIIDNRFVPPSPERIPHANNSVAFIWMCEKYWNWDDEGDDGGARISLLQARQQIHLHYPSFLLWLEGKREQWLTAKGYTDLTWFRGLHENLKCSFLDNFHQCLWADNKYYFSQHNPTATMRYMDLSLICKRYNAEEEENFFRSIQHTASMSVSSADSGISPPPSSSNSELLF